MTQLNSGAIQDVQKLTLSAFSLDKVRETACPAAVLPDNASIESLERFGLERFRFRGAMETTSIDDFARYSTGYASAETPARCFIDADNMRARSIFNIGTLAKLTGQSAGVRGMSAMA